MGTSVEDRHMLRLASTIANEHCNDISWKCRDSEDFLCLADAGIDMRTLCFDPGTRPRDTCPFNKCIDPKTWASALIVLQRYTHKIESIRTLCEHFLHMFAYKHLPDAEVPEQLTQKSSRRSSQSRQAIPKLHRLILIPPLRPTMT